MRTPRARNTGAREYTTAPAAPATRTNSASHTRRRLRPGRLSVGGAYRARESGGGGGGGGGGGTEGAGGSAGAANPSSRISASFP